MAQPIIVLGDTTNHGGVVISAATTATTGGRPIARVGDMVACPRCLGVYPIATGDTSNTIMGQPAARQGDMTACGAVLIASQGVSSS